MGYLKASIATLHKLNWINIDSNSLWIKLLLGFLSLNIGTWEPVSETWIMPADTDLISFELLHHFHEVIRYTESTDSYLRWVKSKAWRLHRQPWFCIHHGSLPLNKLLPRRGFQHGNASVSSVNILFICWEGEVMGVNTDLLYSNAHQRLLMECRTS